MIQMSVSLLLTSLLYAGLIVTFIRIRSAATDVRGPGTTVLAFFSYGVILANRGILGGVWFLDVLLLIVASLFYFRAVAEVSEELPVRAIVTILVSCGLVAGLYLHPAMGFRSTGGAPPVEKACSRNMAVIQGGLEMYALDRNVDVHKTGSEDAPALIRGWATLLTEGKYIDRVPRCPQGGGDYRLEQGAKGMTVVCPGHGEHLALVQEIRKKRPVMSKGHRPTLRSCAANLKTIHGAIEMYALDLGFEAGKPPSAEHPDAKEKLLAPDFAILVDQGYLQLSPDCQATPPGPTTPYRIEEVGTSFRVTCPVHGELADVEALLGP